MSTSRGIAVIRNATGNGDSVPVLPSHCQSKGDAIVTSEKKKRSNKINAQKSTGPATPEGRARAAGNSLRHGLTAEDVLIPGEDPEEFDILREALLHEFGPDGPYEIMLVEEMATLKWRHRRAVRLETAVVKMNMNKTEYEELAGELNPSYTYTGPPPEGEFYKLDPPPTPEERAELLRRFQIARAALFGDRVCRAYVRSTSGEDQLGKLTRYETTIEKAYYRKLHELERHQMRRVGEQVDAPVVVDINVESSPRQGCPETELDETTIDAEICETNPPKTGGDPVASGPAPEEDPLRGATKTVAASKEPVAPKCETKPIPTPAYRPDRHTFGR